MALEEVAKAPVGKHWESFQWSEPVSGSAPRETSRPLRHQTLPSPLALLDFDSAELASSNGPRSFTGVTGRDINRGQPEFDAGA